ncbi:MAG: universal stress protein [Actinomycetota bacterium]
MTVNTIVVAHDGSPGAGRAFDWAVGVAQQTGAGIVVVHAWSPLADLGRHHDRANFAELHEEALADLRSWIADAAASGVTIDARVVEDLPVAGVVHAAREAGADLIVCGTRGRNPLREIVLGSVARQLPEKSHLPVAIIPPA